MTKQEIVKRITSVVWRTQGTKSEAERLLTEYEQAVREEMVKTLLSFNESDEMYEYIESLDNQLKN